MTLNRLRIRWRREEFQPTWFGALINPFFFARRGLLTGLREFLPRLVGDVLDVGCGRKPYRDFVSCRSYVGLEFDTPHARKHTFADAFYEGRTFPFSESRFDGVLCSQVFEHVFTPREFLGEINRVLKPGGLLVLTVPFVWDEHEQPQDYARYSSFGLKAALQSAGFEIELHRRSLPDTRVIFQLINAYLYKVTRSRYRFINLAVMFALLAPVNLIGALTWRLLPGNQDLYLDNIVLARKRVRQ